MSTTAAARIEPTVGVAGWVAYLDGADAVQVDHFPTSRAVLDRAKYLEARGRAHGVSALSRAHAMQQLGGTPVSTGAGAALRALRTGADLSVEDVAKSAGFPSSYIERVESGEVTASSAFYARVGEIVSGPGQSAATITDREDETMTASIDHRILPGCPTWCRTDHAAMDEVFDDPNCIGHSIKFGTVELSRAEDCIWAMWTGYDPGNVISAGALSNLASDVRRAAEFLEVQR